jgi:hypothetical protein
MVSISNFLEQHGPTRAAKLAEWLVSEQGISPEAARKRVSRLKSPLYRFPVPLLPKGESFVYHVDQRKEERFWPELLKAMRDTRSIFGVAIDGLIARGGLVPDSEFSVLAGTSQTGIRGQLMAKTIADRLKSAGVIKAYAGPENKTYLCIEQMALCMPDWNGMHGRQVAEGIVLEAMRDWVRKLGLASYNSIAIREEPERRAVAGFIFDLAGPSYLLPMRSGGPQPGFIVADVFAGAVLDEMHVQYFLRKVSMVHSLLRRRGSGALAFLVADGFTGGALHAGHAAGVSLATPKELFGERAGRALQTLAQTLNNVAAFAASTTPERLAKLIDDLSDIEGAAGNLRGILFELLAAYLVRRGAQSINMGVKAVDSASGKTADIDILKFTNQSSDCVAIECKGKQPGGVLSLEEAEEWIRRLPIFQAHLRPIPQLREANLSFELWTSGVIAADALTYLNKEKAKRTKYPIAWLDGQDVLRLATRGKEKVIADALKQHFLNHALASIQPMPVS